MKKRMRSIATVALAMTMIAGSLARIAPVNQVQAAGGIQQQFYVSVNGDDANDGSAGKPFATVERARQAVDEVNDNMTGDIIVNIGAGEYYFTDTVKFSEKDSGTNGYKVIYQSQDGMGKAKLNGGVFVENWEATTKDDVAMGLDESLVGKVYKTKLDPDVYDFNALYVNDEKAIMARTRNYKHDDRFPAQRGEYMFSAGGGMRDLVWKNGDLDQKSIDGMVAAQGRGEEELAQIFVWDGGDWDWFTNTIPVHYIDVSARKIGANEVSGHPEANRTKYPIGSGARYYLQGNLAFLDVEGEYHYNKKTGDLYYYPKADEKDLAKQKIVVPTVQEIFRFEGSDKQGIENWGAEPDLSKQVSNITIDGLVFKNTEYTSYFTSGWNYSDAGGGIWQHAPEAAGSTNPSYDEQTDRTEYKVGAITMINANQLTVMNTQIHNTGLWGIAMFRDNKNHTIKNCDFGYNGYGSITIDGGYPGVGKYCGYITVENVRMHDVGQNIGHAAALTVMSCSDSSFRNLEIYNSPRRAIMLSGGPKRDATDSQLDQITDMYATRNHFEYIHVYNCEQDSGEDSAVYVCMTYRSQWILDKYGEQVLKTDEEGKKYVDVSWDGTDRHNYFNQMLIDNVTSNPSMRDKNTVHGMDLCMGVDGSVLKNIKGTNNQSCTLRIFTEGYDRFEIDNVNNNYKSDKYYDLFDDSKMEYEKIGLTSSFPFPVEYVQYPEEEKHENIYFSDDFESKQIDTTKWMSELGEPMISWGYMSEGPHRGRYSLRLDGNRNDGGVVLSRPFDYDLNKIVEVKYFDKRQDYAGSDKNEEATPVDITPDHWVRVDNGTDVIAIGANGDISKDYYLYKNGDEIIQTSVQRKAGWHTFKFDYSSGTDVKMYIDGEEIAQLPAQAFNYLGLGDWTGNGGAAYYDQVVIYGGKDAPEPKPLPEIHTIPGKVETEDWNGFKANVKKAGAYDVNWQVKVPEGQTAAFDLFMNGEVVDTVELDSTNGEWQTVTTKLSLKTGLYDMKVEGKSGDFELDWVEFVYVGKETPCRIEAEDYIAQEGTQLDSVNEGGSGLGYIDDGDWMEYKVVVTEPGKYNLNYRVSVNSANGNVDFLANGEKLASTGLPSTGGWQNWTTVSDEVWFEEAGTYTIRLHVVNGGWNINWFELIRSEDQEPPADEIPPALPEMLFEEDFEGEAPTIFEVTQDVITQEILDEDGNKVLYVKSPNGTIYLPNTENWSNYIFESKIKILEWKGNAEGEKPWDNMAPAWYISEPDEKGNRNRYTLKYNRENKTFLLYRRNNGDQDLYTADAPENYEGTWHDYKIVMDDGLITAYVDGEVIFQETNTELSGGTIGFDGINVEYCLDDISVRRLKSAMPVASVPSGEFKENFNVTLSSEREKAVIVYTLNGSDPLENGRLYKGGDGIAITGTTILKFAAVEEGKAYSDVVTCEYVKHEEEVPVTYEVIVQNGTGAGIFEAGAEVTITANASPEGQKFAGWVSEDVEFADASSETTTFLMPAKAVTVTATYRDVEGVPEKPKRADTKELERLIAVAENMDLTGYTQESIAVFKEALEAAKALLAKEPTKDDQSIVDSAASALDEAIKGLKMKDGTTDSGDNEPADNRIVVDTEATQVKVDVKGLDLNKIAAALGIDLSGTNVKLVIQQNKQVDAATEKLLKERIARASQKLLKMYDISMWLHMEGKEAIEIIEDFGSLTISLAAGKEYTGKLVTVYQLHKDGEIITYKDLEVDENGMVTITVTKLSSFAVALQEKTGGSNAGQNAITSAKTGDRFNTDLWTTLALVAGAALLVLARNKKKCRNK